MIKQHLDEGWSGHFMVFMFNPMHGDPRQMNHQMQNEIEGVYASLIARLNRRPHANDAVRPILIACADFPVPKYEKKPLPEVLTNNGQHYNGLLLVPPGPNRLKVSLDQHFADNQSHYLRDQILNRIDIQPIRYHVDRMTDYALKGLKTNRIPDDKAILILPNNHRVRTRPYLNKADAD